MAEKNIPDYEREARRIEEAARKRADRLREAGRLQKPRSELVGELYELLGIEPVEGDRMEAARRKALKRRVTELAAAELQVAELSEAAASRGVPVAATTAAVDGYYDGGESDE